MGCNDYYNYERSSYGYGSQPACGPCQPRFEEMGYVAYTPLPGSRGLEDQLQGAVGFWNSLADPSLGECVNAFGATGREVVANYPQFGCGFGNNGGNNHGYEAPHGGGGYGDGGHGGGAEHANYGGYSSPYAQPFASNQSSYNQSYAQAPNQYSYAAKPARTINYDQMTPEELEHYLHQNLKKKEIMQHYAEAEAAEHADPHASLSNGQYLRNMLTQDQDFQAFLRKRLEEKSSLFGWIQGRVNSDQLTELVETYYSEHPEKFAGRHFTQTDCETAAFQFAEDNGNNVANMNWTKAAIVGGSTLLGGTWWPATTAVGVGIAASIGDGDVVSSGDIHSLKKHH